MVSRGRGDRGTSAAVRLIVSLTSAVGCAAALGSMDRISQMEEDAVPAEERGIAVWLAAGPDRCQHPLRQTPPCSRPCAHSPA
jgi:hypothetical protein